VRIFVKGKIADLLPEKNDPPLNLNVPKPSLTNSCSGSAFGFHATAIPDTGYFQDTNMDDADDANTMDDDANKMDDDADIANEVQDVGEGKDMIHPSFYTFTFLPEPEENAQPIVQGGNLGLSLVGLLTKFYTLI
jgi:hypothetical protein